MSPRRPADPMAAARPIVRERSRGVCERCGQARATDMHHRKLRRHGDHAPANLVHLCRACHAAVHAKPEAAAAAGFIVWRHEDPRALPIVHGLFGRVVLDDAGGYELAA